MAKKFIISEEQYNMALKEGVVLNADVAAAGGDVKRAVDTTKKEAMSNGVKMDDATISIKASDTNESTIKIGHKIDEIVNDILSDTTDDERPYQKQTGRESFRKKPFTSPKFEN